ncbi:hypothetical protein AgCh_025610 [Apium graveolens]
MGDSSVFTEDPIEILNAPSCANHSSQTVRFEDSAPEGELSKSSPIQLEVPHVGTTPLKTLAEIALTVDARSTMVIDPAMGEARLSHPSDSALQEAQGFEIGAHDSNPVKSPPIQLEVPTLCEEQQLVKTTKQSMSKTVTSVTGEKFREEYITILGSNARSLTPQEVYDAINEVYKAQIKAFHNFGKALKITLNGYQDKVMKMVREKMDQIIPSQTEIKNQFKIFSKQMSRYDLSGIEKSVNQLKESFIALHKTSICLTGDLEEKGSSVIVFKVMGRAINKTVTIMELIKSGIAGLHKVTSI